LRLQFSFGARTQRPDLEKGSHFAFFSLAPTAKQRFTCRVTLCSGALGILTGGQDFRINRKEMCWGFFDRINKINRIAAERRKRTEGCPQGEQSESIDRIDVQKSTGHARISGLAGFL